MSPWIGKKAEQFLFNMYLHADLHAILFLTHLDQYLSVLRAFVQFPCL